MSTSIKGRGSASTMAGRFAIRTLELDPDSDTNIASVPTEIRHEHARSLITRNRSPDVPFNVSINPYRGCEHGCVYCFARPSHSYLDLSPGLDFETRISAKTNAPALLREALSRPGYRCEPIALGINTDAYQPIERELQITRQLLQVASDFNQPVSLITKSALILRDLDLLGDMAERNLVQVAISVTTLDNNLKRILEPRTASGATRVKTIRALCEAGVPVSALIAPVIPLINESEIEDILDAVAFAGALSASYILLRLPHEVAPLFCEWLREHFPDRANHVLSRLRELRGGKLYDNRFGERMRGQGIFADLIKHRFAIAARRLGLSTERSLALDCSRFHVPGDDQMALF
ncbi:PA0069 family radical SAM protein [Litorivivens sp.]|uniref:PA0069 family radical SAM protein n=1 Tax=Litorivivens sp. TaxID=2020868 RepID=UPI0035617110